MDAYLDTNAVLELFPRVDSLYAAEARRLLKLRVAQRRVDLAVTGILLQELARHSEREWPRYHRTIRYLRLVAGHRLQLDSPFLIAAELREGGRLGGTARFADRAFASRMWRAVAHRGFLVDVVAEARKEAHDYAEVHKRLRAQVAPQLDGVTPNLGRTIGMRRWWAKGAEAFLSDVMVPELVRAGYEPTFDPRRFPAFWHAVAYRFARVVLDTSEDRRIEPSDYADPRHYAAAAYSDVFVSDDGPMLAAHRLVPKTGVRLVKLKEFVATHLSD